MPDAAPPAAEVPAAVPDEALAAAVHDAVARLQAALNAAWSRGLMVRVELWDRRYAGRTDPLPMVGAVVARPL